MVAAVAEHPGLTADELVMLLELSASPVRAALRDDPRVTWRKDGQVRRHYPSISISSADDGGPLRATVVEPGEGVRDGRVIK